MAPTTRITIIPSRGKGADVRVELGDRVTHVPTGSGELKTGLLQGILRHLGLTYPGPAVGGRRETGIRSVGMANRFDPGRGGSFIVNFPDLPNGWSQGETRDEALAQADDLLDEMLLGSMAHNEDVPRPSPRKGRPRSWLCQP